MLQDLLPPFVLISVHSNNQVNLGSFSVCAVNNERVFHFARDGIGVIAVQAGPEYAL